MTEPTTHTLAVPGAELCYDIRAASTPNAEPPLLIIGSPMDAAAFVTLAGHFTDRTVVTYDPRGAGRSVRPDPLKENEVAEHADDLHRVITAVSPDAPVDIFATSGGAVNALALVATHPGDVRTLVAHEPPAATLLPDREAALAACRSIRQTYQAEGHGPAMAMFIGLVSHVGPIPDDFATGPAPDPAMFGLSTEDDGSRDDPLVGQNVVTCNAYEYDFDALGAASTTVIAAVSETGEGTLAYRGGVAIAQGLGSAAVTFPGDHAGFLGGEYGMVGKPDEFGAKLRAVLADAVV